MSKGRDRSPDQRIADEEAAAADGFGSASPGLHEAGGAEAAAQALSLPSPFRSLGGAWMITFTDLIALMLTFFVLLYSMSSLEKQKWRELVGAFSEQLNTMTPSDAPRPTVVLQIKKEQDPAPGADLDYLEPILIEQLAADPELSALSLRRGRRGVVLSLPAGSVFDGAGAGTTAAARRLAYPLARLLANLGNSIELTVVTRSDVVEPGFRSPWAFALARAESVSDLLAHAGYDGPLIARAAVADPSRDPAGAPTERIDIVITKEARGSE